MTPDQLRDLANRLEPMAAAPCFDGIDIAAAAAYLRAHADAQPIGYATANGLRMLKQDDATVLLYAHDYLIRPDHVALYTHPAPAAPHRAMLDSHRRLVEQAIQSAEHPSGMSTHDGKARIDASILHRMLAIIDSLPAAPQEGNVWKQIIPDDVPQAEPIDPHMIAAEDRFPDAPQAEPKREPLLKLLELADLSDDSQYGTLSTSVVRDLVNEALGRQHD